MIRRFLVSVCVVVSLLFSGCEPVLSPADRCSRPTIYAFSAPGCLACIRDKPSIEWLERAGYRVVRIDIVVQPDWRRRYNINAVPLYFVVCNGRVSLRTSDLNIVIRAVNNGRKIQRQAALSQLP